MRWEQLTPAAAAHFQLLAIFASTLAGLFLEQLL